MVQLEQKGRVGEFFFINNGHRGHCGHLTFSAHDETRIASAQTTDRGSSNQSKRSLAVNGRLVARCTLRIPHRGPWPPKLPLLQPVRELRFVALTSGLGILAQNQGN